MRGILSVSNQNTINSRHRLLLIQNNSKMFRVIAIIISLLLASSVVVIGHPHSGRIVGGYDADIENYPYQVSLEIYGEHKCGGSIISEWFVVTSAQCTESLSEGDIAVRAGSSIKASGGTLIAVKNIHHNPNYDPQSKNGDISILELDEALVYGSGIQPVALPEPDEVLETGAVVTVSGWGDLWNNGTYVESGRDQLQAVEIHIAFHDQCRLMYSIVLDSEVTDAMICASEDEESYKTFCHGDDGGPLVFDGKLHGIISWGYLCIGAPLPGVYTKIPDDDVRGFITSVTGI